MILQALLWIWTMRLFRRRLWNIQTNGRKEKWEVMNKLTIRFLCSNIFKDEILATALTFWLAFLHSPSTSSQKQAYYHFLSPKNFSLHVLESFSLQISTWWLFLSRRRRWNLSGFTFIQLFRNHKVRLSATPLTSSISSNSEQSPIANGVLSTT